MSKITDKIILEALQSGKVVSLNDDLILRELLKGSEGVLYALYSEETRWQPYSPNVWELSQDNWTIESEN